MRPLTCGYGTMRLRPPLRQQPHARRAQDVEGRLPVLGRGDVGGGKAQEGVQVVAGLGGAVCQRGDTWGGGGGARQLQRSWVSSPAAVSRSASERRLTNANVCLSPREEQQTRPVPPLAPPPGLREPGPPKRPQLTSPGPAPPWEGRHLPPPSLDSPGLIFLTTGARSRSLICLMSSSVWGFPLWGGQ